MYLYSYSTVHGEDACVSIKCKSMCVTESQLCHCIPGDYIILKALPDRKLMK